MVGMGKRRISLPIDGEQQNTRETVIEKKRKQLDEEKRAIDEKEHIFKTRNEIADEQVVAIGKKIDQERIIATKKRKRFGEEEIAISKKTKADEEEEIYCCKSLPDELWTENILTRLPGRVLAKCSSVSKLWCNSVFHNTRFAANHNLQNKNNTVLIFDVLNLFKHQTFSACYFSLQDKPGFISHLETPYVHELVGYCNGLECIKEVPRLGAVDPDAVGSITVINPMRAEALTLCYNTPAGAAYMHLCHGFGFDSSSQVYKAVLVFTSKDNEEILCMVITLGTCSWRNITTKVADISPPPGSSPFPSQMVTRVSKFSVCRPATLCGDDLLWRTTSEVDDGCQVEMLLSFDLHSEKIQFIRMPDESTLPSSVMDDRRYLAVDHLLEYKGYPCIARSEKITASKTDHCGHRCDYQGNQNCCCCCKVHMYILKDKVKQLWCKDQTFDVQIEDPEGLLPAPLCCYFETSAVTPPTRILTISNQVLLYWFNGENLILYNLLEKYLKVVRCSSTYPGIFQTKMNQRLDRSIGDDENILCPYMDYHLHAQVENLVSLKIFIPKEAETSRFDCSEDLTHSVKSNPPAGWVVMGRKSFNSYVFRQGKEVDVEVTNVLQGPNGSCRSKQSRSGKATLRRPLIAKRSNKVQPTGSGFSQPMKKCGSMVPILEKHKVTSNPVPVAEWMAALKGVPDLDEDLKLEAIDFLGGDSISAEVLVALSPDLRKRWLTRKLRPNLLVIPQTFPH